MISISGLLDILYIYILFANNIHGLHCHLCLKPERHGNVLNSILMKIAVGELRR